MKSLTRFQNGLRLALPLLLWACQGSSAELPGPWIPVQEREAADLSGAFWTLEGEEVNLEQFQQKVLFLNLWATWCGPCRFEMPSMANLYEELKGQGLNMLAISNEDPESVRAFLEENPYPFTILLDPNNALIKRFRVSAIPTTLIIDSQGRVVLKHVGYRSWDTPEMIRSFQQLLSSQ